jgi:hypothetical protein
VVEVFDTDKHEVIFVIRPVTRNMIPIRKKFPIPSSGKDGDSKAESKT